MHINPDNEATLLRQLADGDEQAFVRIYENYQPRLHLYIFPLTGFSRQDTDEILQDIFIKVWLRRETLITIESLQAYLFAMARNRLYDLKTKHTQLQEVARGLQSITEAYHNDASEQLELAEYHEIAREAINSLPPQKKRIFTMRNEEELSLDEIAIRLNISKFAVKKQLYDAIHLVRDKIRSGTGLNIPIIILICVYL